MAKEKKLIKGRVCETFIIHLCFLRTTGKTQKFVSMWQKKVNEMGDRCESSHSVAFQCKFGRKWC